MKRFTHTRAARMIVAGSLLGALAQACGDTPMRMPPPAQRRDAGPRTDGGTDGGTDDTGVAPDTTPPRVTMNVPADMATGIALNAEIRAQFDEPIDCTSVTQTTMLVSVSGGGTVNGNPTCANGPNGSIRYMAGGGLIPRAEHTVTILPEVKDLAGNTLAMAYSWKFTTAAMADTTPPVDPTITMPSPIPANTSMTPFNAGGAKEADANVEARWLVGGNMRHDFMEVVAVDQSATWSHAFPLDVGDNQYLIRSRDAAGNLSCGGNPPSPACTAGFSITRTMMQMMVNPPTVIYAAMTDAPKQVVQGTKPANSAVERDGMEVVALSPSTTWFAELTHNVGANAFSFVARDQFGNRSAPAAVNVTYTPGANVGPNADLQVEFELSDMWNEVGDEYRINSTKREIGVYAPIIWLEGPLARLSDNGTPADFTDDSYEPCVYDDTAQERRFTRYSVTVNYTTYADDAGVFQGLYGHWGEPNYFVANWFAAVVEAGIYANVPFPVARDVDRRNPMGNTWWWQPGMGACPPIRRPDGAFCPPRMVMIGPPIDVITEASVHPRYDNRGRATLGVGNAPGSWTTGLLTYPRRTNDDPMQRKPPVRPIRSWDWTDHWHTPLKKGAYLLTVLFVIDRSDPNTQAPGRPGATAPYQWLDVLRSDFETCWDRRAHDTIGSHRSEAVIVLGDSAQTLYLDEKGPPETSDACHAAREGVRCSGSDACDWNFNHNFGDDAACVAPANRTGVPIQYTVPQNGWPKSVRFRYCPNGPCS